MNFTLFSERLKAIRISRNLSQDEFADILGTSKQVISRYETGQRVPKISTVADYAERLHVAQAYLLGEAPASPSDFEISDHEKEIIIAYRKALSNDRDIIDNIAGRYTRAENEKIG